MVDRFAWGGMLDIVAQLAQLPAAAVLLPDGVAILGAAEHRPHLPMELRADLAGFADFPEDRTCLGEGPAA
jgi:hypothetical protein